MREILFRGKRIPDQAWCYGNLVVKKSGMAIITPDDTPLGKYGAVSPETVGQYTGCNDNAGNPVFEGDILKAYYDDEDPGTETLSVVEWEQNGWRVKPIGCPVSDELDDYALKINTVIGNIHDDPELLEVSDGR